MLRLVATSRPSVRPSVLPSDNFHAKLLSFVRDRRTLCILSLSLSSLTLWRMNPLPISTLGPYSGTQCLFFSPSLL